MNSNIFVKMNVKSNPDIEPKLQDYGNTRKNEKFTQSTAIYNPITGVVPEKIKTSQDLALEKDDKISNIKGYHYNFINNDKPCVGVIAQEIQNVLPEAVSNINNILGVNYSSLIPLLINGIQDLKGEIELLKDKIKILESKI